MLELLIQAALFAVVYTGMGVLCAWYKENRPFRCIWFGHRFRRETTGMTEVNGWPVFRCRRCRRQWIPAPGPWGHNVTPGKLDRFERFAIAKENSDGISR